MVCALNVNRYKPLAINRMKPLTHVSQAMLFTLRGQGPMNGVSGLYGFTFKPWVLSRQIPEEPKFIYGVVKEGARAKDFELAVEWLRNAGLVYKVNRCKKPQLPWAAYEGFSASKSENRR